VDSSEQVVETAAWAVVTAVEVVMDAVVAGNKEVAGASVVVEMVARAETAVAYEMGVVVLFEVEEVVETAVAGIAVGDGVVAVVWDEEGVAAVEEDGQVVAAGG